MLATKWCIKLIDPFIQLCARGCCMHGIISFPPQTPHLVNLNEDATLSECLLYYIKEGVTRIGSPEANIPQDIQLVGAHILSEHCVFENSEGIVKLVPLVSGVDSRPYVLPICDPSAHSPKRIFADT